MEKAELDARLSILKPSQRNQLYDPWVRNFIAVSGKSNKMLSVGIMKPTNCSRIYSVARVQGDLEILISRCSVESHTFGAAWGEFVLILEDVLNNMALPLYGETNAMGSMFMAEDEDNLRQLTEASSFSISLYSSWINYFDEGE